MQKILIFITLFCLTTLQVAANCLISNSEAPVLTEYFQNTNKILTTLTNEIRSHKAPSSNNAVIDEVSNEVTRVSDAIVWAYNRAFDFEYFQSDFEFTLEVSRANEHPKEILRDYELIKNYNDRLRNYLSTIIRSGKRGVIIEDFCEKTGVKRCNIAPNQSAEQIMQIIIVNHTKLKYVFEQIVAGKTSLETNILFTPENFHLEMLTYYGAQSISACNYENEFAKSVREKTNNIATIEQNNKKAIQKWKDAWQLLNADTSQPAYKQIERNILRKELQRQGVSADNQSIMLNNLDRFNVEGFSVNNNLFTNTFRSLQQKVEEQIHKFENQKLAGFLDNQQEVGIGTTIQTNKKAEEIKDSIAELNNLHAQLELYAAQTGTNSSTLTDQILNIHLDLSESINTLTTSCKIAVKLCNNQARSKGNCGTCN